MKISLNLMLLLALLPFTIQCSKMHNSPWETNLEAEMQGLTVKNLDKLENSKQEFPIKIALTADPQGFPGHFKKVIDEVNKHDPDFILVLGDITDYGLKQEYVWAYKAIKGAVAPVLTVIGNHDALSYGKSLYNNMFGEYEYTFEYAGINFIMWNNNRKEFMDTVPNWDWLESKLNSRSVVASHIVPTLDSTYSQEELDKWKRINTEKSPLISLHGHRHVNYFWQEDGVNYYVTPRVKDVHYSLMTINEDLKITLETCKDNACVHVEDLQ